MGSVSFENYLASLPAGTAAADLSGYEGGAAVLVDTDGFATQAELDALVISGGGISVASEAEAIAGANNTKAMTPARVKTVLPFRVAGAPSGDTSGTTDTAALAALLSAGDGEIHLHPGTYWVTGLTLYSNLHLRGAVRGGTVVKLADSADTDVFVSDGFSGLTGGTTQGGIHDFKLSNLTIDGNRANNASGWCLRVYAYRYMIDNVQFTDGKSGGVWTQWGTGGTNMEAHWSNFKIWNCEGNLMHNIGPHDSLFVNGSVFNDSSQTDDSGTLVHSAANTGGCQWTNVHAWGNCATAFYVGEAQFFTGCQAEGATDQNVAFATSGVSWVGGHIFGTNSVTAEYGVKFGTGADVSSCQVIGCEFSQFGAASRPVVWISSSGNNVVTGTIRTGAALAVSTGTKHPTDVIAIGDPTIPYAATGIWLPGTSGNYVSCPDAAGLDITGDITLVAHIAPDDWSPAASAVIIGKRASNATHSYRLILTTAGALQLIWSPDGTDASQVAITSTANLSALANGSPLWIAADLDVDNGSTQKVVRFWTSLNGSVWTALGTTSTTASTTSIFVSTSVLEIGSNAVGTANLYVGKVFSASVRSGRGTSTVGGTEVARFDANASRGQRWRDVAGNLFTTNGSAWYLTA